MVAAYVRTARPLADPRENQRGKREQEPEEGDPHRHQHFLPGGIGLTEASMAGILMAAGMGASGASAATLVTRVAALWWSVGVGWVALGSRPAVLRTVLGHEAPEE